MFPLKCPYPSLPEVRQPSPKFINVGPISGTPCLTTIYY